MRFLLDENVSYRVAGQLKAAGLDAVHVGELGLTSTEDVVILSRALHRTPSAVTTWRPGPGGEVGAGSIHVRASGRQFG